MQWTAAASASRRSTRTTSTTSPTRSQRSSDGFQVLAGGRGIPPGGARLARRKPACENQAALQLEPWPLRHRIGTRLDPDPGKEGLVRPALAQGIRRTRLDAIATA